MLRRPLRQTIDVVRIACSCSRLCLCFFFCLCVCIWKNPNQSGRKVAGRLAQNTAQLGQSLQSDQCQGHDNLNLAHQSRGSRSPRHTRAGLPSEPFLTKDASRAASNTWSTGTTTRQLAKRMLPLGYAFLHAINYHDMQTCNLDA